MPNAAVSVVVHFHVGVQQCGGFELDHLALRHGRLDGEFSVSPLFQFGLSTRTYSEGFHFSIPLAKEPKSRVRGDDGLLSGDQYHQQNYRGSHQHAFGDDLQCLPADLPDFLLVFDLFRSSIHEACTTRSLERSGLVESLEDGGRSRGK